MSSQGGGKPEVLSIKVLYPLAFSLSDHNGANPNFKLAQWTGTIRPPKKGEYFLSGPVIAAYRALHDMADAYPIARLVEVQPATTMKIIRFL